MKRRKLIKETAYYSEKLTAENQKLFEKILLTIRYSRLSETDAEGFSHHCLNLFLQAEKEGVPVKTVLGTDDLDDFCADYIEQVYGAYSLPKKLLLKLYYIPEILFLFTGLFGMLLNLLIPSWIEYRKFTFDVGVPLSLVTNSILAIGVVSLVLHFMDRWILSWEELKKAQKRKWLFLLWGGNALIIGIFVLSIFYLNQIVFHVNFLVFLLVCVILDRLMCYASEKMN